MTRSSLPKSYGNPWCRWQNDAYMLSYGPQLLAPNHAGIETIQCMQQSKDQTLQAGRVEFSLFSIFTEIEVRRRCHHVTQVRL
jgi:hypothetical protein